MNRAVTHQEHQKDFDAGYDAAMLDFEGLGKSAAEEKWRMENPQSETPSSLGAYYYAEGGIHFLSQI